jgi:hypothetical protein
LKTSLNILTYLLTDSIDSYLTIKVKSQSLVALHALIVSIPYPNFLSPDALIVPSMKSYGSMIDSDLSLLSNDIF